MEEIAPAMDEGDDDEFYSKYSRESATKRRKKKKRSRRTSGDKAGRELKSSGDAASFTEEDVLLQPPIELPEDGCIQGSINASRNSRDLESRLKQIFSRPRKTSTRRRRMGSEPESTRFIWIRSKICRVDDIRDFEYYIKQSRMKFASSALNQTQIEAILHRMETPDTSRSCTTQSIDASIELSVDTGYPPLQRTISQISRQLSNLSSPHLSTQNSMGYGWSPENWSDDSNSLPRNISSGRSLSVNVPIINRNEGATKSSNCPELCLDEVRTVKSTYAELNSTIDQFYTTQAELFDTSNDAMEFFKRLYPQRTYPTEILEYLNAWLNITQILFEKLHTVGKLFNESTTSLFSCVKLETEDINPHASFDSQNVEDIGALDFEHSLCEDTPPSLTGVSFFIGKDDATEVNIEQYIKRYARKSVDESLYRVKKIFHKSLIKVHYYLWNRLEYPFERRYVENGGVVLDEDSFPVFFKRPQKNYAIYDSCLTKISRESLVHECVMWDSEMPKLPSLLYFYVFLLRLERSVAAAVMENVLSSVSVSSDSDHLARFDREQLASDVTVLVNVITACVCEKIYFCKLISPFIGMLTHEEELTVETRHFDQLLHSLFDAYTLHCYRSFTFCAPGSISPREFDKSIFTIHWPFVCKMSGYIQGACHFGVDPFCRTVRLFFSTIKEDMKYLVQDFCGNLVPGNPGRDNPEHTNSANQLNSSLASLSTRLKLVSSFSRKLFHDLGICGLYHVGDIDEFFNSIKETHVLLRITQDYMRSENVIDIDCEEITIGSSTCYLVDRTLLGDTILLRKLLLAMSRKCPKKTSPDDEDGERTSSSKSEEKLFSCASRNQTLPRMETSHFSRSTTNIRRGSFQRKTVEDFSLSLDNPSGSGSQTVVSPSQIENPSLGDVAPSKSDSLRSGLNDARASDTESSTSSHAYLLIMSPVHASKWKYESKEILPPFYSFLPELSSSQPLHPDEVTVVALQSSVLEHFNKSPLSSHLEEICTPVPRVLATRTELASLYQCEDSNRTPCNFDEELEDGSSVIFSLLNELVECFQRALKKVAEYVVENRKSNSGGKYTPPLLALSKRFINNLFCMATQYCRDLVFLLPEKPACIRRQLAKQSFELGRAWINYVVSVTEPGFKSRWKRNGINFLALIASKPIATHLNEEEQTEFLALSEKLYDHMDSSGVSTGRSSHDITRRRRENGVASSFSAVHNVDEDTTTSSDGDSGMSNHSNRFEDIANMVVRRRRERALKMMREIRVLELRAQPLKKTSDTVVKDKDGLARSIRHTYVQFSWKAGRFRDGIRRKVYEGVREDTQQSIAIKTIEFQHQSSYERDQNQGIILVPVELDDYLVELSQNDRTAYDMLKNGLDEVRQLVNLKHQHIVQFFGVALSRGSLHICMELCDESIRGLARKANDENHFSALTFRTILRQVVQALQYIHSRGIAHLDIKGDNILLNERGRSVFQRQNSGEYYRYHAKIGDFGCFIDKNMTNNAGLVGTEGFVAPELFEDADRKSVMCDIWSLGCMVIQIFCDDVNPLLILGALDKDEITSLEYNIVYFKFRYGGFKPRLPKIDVSRGISQECINFIDKCIQLEPEDRTSAADLLSDPFLYTAVGY